MYEQTSGLGEYTTQQLADEINDRNSVSTLLIEMDGDEVFREEYAVKVDFREGNTVLCLSISEVK